MSLGRTATVRLQVQLKQVMDVRFSPAEFENGFQLILLRWRFALRRFQPQIFFLLILCLLLRLPGFILVVVFALRATEGHPKQRQQSESRVCRMCYCKRRGCGPSKL
jgi:hypothetical protein